MTAEGSETLSPAEVASAVSGRLEGAPSGAELTHLATVDRLIEGHEGSGAAVVVVPDEDELKRLAEAPTPPGLIVLPDTLEATGPHAKLPRVRVAEARLALALLSARFDARPRPAPGQVSPAAHVHESATLGRAVTLDAGAWIGKGAVVGDGSYVGPGSTVGAGSRLGANCVLNANVTIYDGVTLGDRVVLHAGAVIGADGFGYAASPTGAVKVRQLGGVTLGDDVEIGANTAVDRGAIDDTVIEDGVKLDNQIQVGHNVRIGAHTAIAACVGIAGSSRIGRYCRIGGASGIAGHLSIADRVEISAHTLITKSISEPGTYTGAYPFESNRDWRRNAASLRSLGELASRVRAIEQELQLRKKGKK